MAAIVLARLKVKDYEEWRGRFEGNAETRKAAGCLGTHIFFNALDKSDVTINFLWEDEDGARKFLSGPEAERLRAAGGVVTFDYWVVADGGRTAS
jgi:quinol monooxygenase YgiN